MVMEYLEGVDLKDLVIERGVLPPAEATDYVIQACVAMAEAHRAGIVHRDLKPDNLFLTRRPDGSPLVKVLDFGISKLYESGDPNDAARRTQASTVMGSPAYMSPEQARSARDADERSDIWALGVILYELTSRQLPFRANVATAELLAQLIYEKPRSLAVAAPKLPEAFCAAVDHCLEKDPARRYPDVAQLAAALAPFATAAGRAHVASIQAMVAGPDANATRGYPDVGRDATEPWLDDESRPRLADRPRFRPRSKTPSPRRSPASPSTPWPISTPGKRRRLVGPQPGPGASPKSSSSAPPARSARSSSRCPTRCRAPGAPSTGLL